MYDAASTVMAQKLSQIPGVGQVTVGGTLRCPASESNSITSVPLGKYGISFRIGAHRCSRAPMPTLPKGHFTDGINMWEVGANDQITKAVDYEPLVIAYRTSESPFSVSDVGEAVDSGRRPPPGWLSWTVQPAVLS